MNENILELIYNYSINNFLIDEEFMENIFNIIVKDEKLSRYAKEIKFVTEDEERKKLRLISSFVAFMTYSSKDKAIIVCLDKVIDDSCLIEHKEVSKILTKYELLFFKNIIITQILLHELGHVKQSKISKEEDNMESKILSSCIKRDKIKLFGDQNKIFSESLAKYLVYCMNWKYAPNERMAEINSHKELINILLPLKDDIPNIFSYLKARLIKSLIEGYQDTISPTIKYFKDMCQEKTLESFDWYSKDNAECIKKSSKLYSLRQRITCGLPVENEIRLELINKLNINK